jgi:hypothetical protein
VGVGPGTVAGVAVLVAGGTLVVIGSMLWHAGRAASLAGGLQPGFVGAALLAGLCLVLLPNASIAAAGLATGPGFAVGLGTHVSVAGVHLAAEPAVPLLAALPAAGPAPVPVFFALAIPVAAGVAAAGILRRRRADGPALEQLAAALAIGAGTGFSLLALTALAGGPVGPGQLATVGASPWQVALASAGEVGVVAVATTALRLRWPSLRRLRLD